MRTIPRFLFTSLTPAAGRRAREVVRYRVVRFRLGEAERLAIRGFLLPRECRWCRVRRVGWGQVWFITRVTDPVGSVVRSVGFVIGAPTLSGEAD